MAKVTKNIGKLPVHKGAWVSGTAYARLNQVTHEGSCLQSKVDNNTATPITIDMHAGTFAVHASWQIIADGTTAKIAAAKANEAKDQIAENIKTRVGVFHGLGFKSGDNSVNLTTPKINLGLGDFTLVIYANTEGVINEGYPLLGFSKTNYTKGIIRIDSNSSRRGSNGLEWVFFEKPIEGIDSKNSVPVLKTDNTKNPHTIILKRQGTRVIFKVNNRLVKEVIHDRVLDFSEFQTDIANTSYFSSLRLLNFFTDEAMDDQLWNGGRCDEVVLDRYLKINKQNHLIDLQKATANQCNKEVFSSNGISGYKFSVTDQTGFVGFNYSLILKASERIDVKFKLWLSSKDSFDPSPSTSAWGGVFCTNNANYASNIKIDYTKINEWQDVVIFGVPARDSGAFYANVKTADNWYAIADINVAYSQCLLELLPQNIHSKGIYNTGSLGSSHDAVFSKPNETIFHKERPYKDKQMITGAPSFHPIAMGQECTDQLSGAIYKASVPPVGEEWAVKHWKQINNS